jgi:hypothetical protein
MKEPGFTIDPDTLGRAVSDALESGNKIIFASMEEVGADNFCVSGDKILLFKGFGGRALGEVNKDGSLTKL